VSPPRHYAAGPALYSRREAGPSSGLASGGLVHERARATPIAVAACALLVSFSSASPGAPAQDEVMTYIHHPPESAHDVRYLYQWEVLRMALEKTTPQWGPYRLVASEVMTERRQAYELRNATGALNVMYLGTTPEFERELVPVRIPIDRSLGGYGIFLVRAADEGAVLDTCDVARIAVRPVAVRTLGVIELGERSAIDERLAELLVLLGAPVAPVDGSVLQYRGPIRHPLLKPLIAARATHEKSLPANGRLHQMQVARPTRIPEFSYRSRSRGAAVRRDRRHRG